MSIIDLGCCDVDTACMAPRVLGFHESGQVSDAIRKDGIIIADSRPMTAVSRVRAGGLCENVR